MREGCVRWSTGTQEKKNQVVEKATGRIFMFISPHSASQSNTRVLPPETLPMATMLSHAALARPASAFSVSRRSVVCTRSVTPSSTSAPQQQREVNMNGNSASRCTASPRTWPWTVCATAHDSDLDCTEDRAVGFVPVVRDAADGTSTTTTAAKGDVPLAAQSDYRKVEDPEWLERELLRADDGYPTSRGGVIAQSLKTGDWKGLSYAVSSVNIAAGLWIGAYVALAAARVETSDGDALFTNASDAVATVGSFWVPLLVLAAVSSAVEVVKFIDTVVGVQNRRKM